MSSDYKLGDTLYLPFTTRQFSDGVPTILTGSPVITGHRDDNLTQFTTGITLAADFDGIAGLNMITVVATGGNSYVAGESYMLYISAGTVGGVSVVGEVVAHFTLSMSAAVADIATAQTDLDTITDDWNDGGRLDLIQDIIAADVVNIDGIVPANAAAVNAQVLDVINVDTYSEPAQGAIPAAPTIREMLHYIHLAHRNKIIANNSTGFMEVYDDAGSTVLFKWPFSYSDPALTRSEAETG